MVLNANTNDPLTIGERSFTSRLFLGTGKFASTERMQEAIDSSATEMVTVALRRIDFSESSKADLKENLIEAIDTSRIQLLPNTSGAADAEQAIRLAKMARAMGCGNWLKLEIHPNPRHLMPDPIETLKAAEQLVKDGFIVLPYINADPVLARRLEDVGCATVMPLGAPIGSNRGLKTRDNIEIIIEEAGIPVVVDAGLGWPSQAAEAMEIGADAVLVNTAIAVSPDPAGYAAAFKQAVEAGRTAYLLGGPASTANSGKNSGDPSPGVASPTSPLTAFLDS